MEGIVALYCILIVNKLQDMLTIEAELLKYQDNQFPRVITSYFISKQVSTLDVLAMDNSSEFDQELSE